MKREPMDMQKLLLFQGGSGGSHVATWALPEKSIARLGQGTVIGNITLSPDGKYLAVGSCIGVWWYDVTTMTPISLFDTDRGYISAISFSPDGRWLATSDGDGIVKVWDVKQGICVSKMEREKTERLYHSVSHLVFSPNSQFLAAASTRDYILYVWNAGTGEQIAKFHDDTNYRWFPFLRRPIAFSPDGRLLACTTPDDNFQIYADRHGNIRTSKHSSNSIAVWNIKTKKRIACLAHPTGFVLSLSFSPCGHSLAAGSEGTVQVWNVKTWQPRRSYSDYGTFSMNVSYSQTGLLYAVVVSEDSAVVWDVERREKYWTYLEEQGPLQAVHFSRNGQFIIAGAKEWTVWMDRLPQPYKFRHSHFHFPDSVVFAADGKTVGAGFRADRVMLWDIADAPFQEPRTFNLPGKNHRVSISLCGEIQSTSIDGSTAKVSIVRESKLKHAFTLSEKKGNLTAAAFAQTGEFLACGGPGGTVSIWNVQTGETLHTLTQKLEDEAWIQYMAFSQDGKLLVSISDHGPVSQMWDTESGEAIAEFPNNVGSVAFSPCSTMLACGRRQEIFFWDVRRSEICLMISQSNEDFWADALAFSPCGRYLASGYSWTRGVNMEKVAIRLWDVATGENVVTLRGHPTDVQDLAFSPDGTLLASASFDGTILLWDIKPYL